jgi:hypothetical protein
MISLGTCSLLPVLLAEWLRVGRWPAAPARAGTDVPQGAGAWQIDDVYVDPFKHV